MKEFVEKLIGRLEKNGQIMSEAKSSIPFGKHSSANHRYYKAISVKKAIHIVNQLAEEYNGGWILCSEELPPQPKENPLFDNKPLEIYLVSDSISDYPYRAFWNGKFWTDGFSNVEVIAWQPLPPKYEPKAE